MRNTAPFCPTASCERLLISSHQRGRAGVERGFKVLKSDIEIATVYHRLPERIRTHASICFMALILPRVVRSRLKAADAGYTPERALEQLQRIQHHRVRLNGGEPMEGTSAISTEHKVLTAVDSRTNPASTAGTAQHDLDLVSG